MRAGVYRSFSRALITLLKSEFYCQIFADFCSGPGFAVALPFRSCKSGAWLLGRRVQEKFSHPLLFKVSNTVDFQKMN